jgi:CBS domain containing-hemolysin-like protein
VLTVVGLVAVAGLVLATSFFVAAEFAYVAARRGRLEELATAGDGKAATAVEVHKRLSFMLSGAQLGITVTSLVIGFVAEPTLGRALDPLVEAIGVPESAQRGVTLTVGFLIATVAQMVIGELAPKSIAIARAEPVARVLARPTLLFMQLAGPVIRVFDGAANWLLHTVGIDPVEELHGGVSTEELDLIVLESAGRGQLTDQQAALLSRALQFGELRAASVMVPWNKVVTVADEDTGEDLRQAMEVSAHSRFPVVADGAVVGIVHAKDLLGVPAADLASVRVASLANPVTAVPEAAGLRVVLGRLQSAATELALVVDEYGAPAGVVTLEDLVEELVGDIADEHDPDDLGAEAEGAGTWSVPGGWRLDEIARVTGIDLPLGDYDTVAGLVLDHLQRVAVEGDHITVADTTVQVLETDGWAVTRVRLAPSSAGPPDPAAPNPAASADPTEPQS